MRIERRPPSSSSYCISRFPSTAKFPKAGSALPLRLPPHFTPMPPHFTPMLWPVACAPTAQLTPLANPMTSPAPPCFLCSVCFAPMARFCHFFVPYIPDILLVGLHIAISLDLRDTDQAFFAISQPSLHPCPSLALDSSLASPAPTISCTQSLAMHQLLTLFCLKSPGKGAPGWLSLLSVRLQLRSRSHGL